jgi:phosphate-selective porin OprO and OprP
MRALWAIPFTVTLAASGCATPTLIPWEPPAIWKPDQALSPPPLPAAPPVKVVDATQFATEIVQQTEANAPATVTPTPAQSASTIPPAASLAPPTTLPSSTETLLPDLNLDKATESKDPSFKLRGRVEADSVSVTQSPKDKALFGDFQDAVGFRRLRLGSEGTAGDMTRWVAEIDFAGGNVAVKDAFVAVNNLPILQEVRVGHMAEPFSLEGQTRSIWFPFTERSPIFTFDPARNWGVGIFSFTEDKTWVLQAGLFKTGTDSSGTDVGDGNDLAGTGRLVWVPWYNDANDSLQMLHIGGAASLRNAKDGTVTFNQGPQSSLLQSGSDNPRTPFVPSVSIPADHYQLYNLQSALVLGPLSFEAEWNATRVEQIGGGPVVLSGWYVQASYFLTGEHRNYNREAGTFWEPTVRRPFVCKDGSATARGPGAWELAARLAYLDFDSPNLPRGSNGQPVGTRTTTLTIGLNWYLNDNVRIMLDWVHDIPDFPPFGSSTADQFTVRTAVFW